ncbi:GAF and ANTAR domain-containing protein [Arsenicicoccus sp. oral taxon 190]|uniref:GAF and ANTAR domain-containing protein n=1 Tax=Arsenicicoccus sp. oral taxon 190 TaxID=1658671 RepID=UPI00067C8D85|nr:GAF and ANTAR domain-containing protein [Arsenicicoccus sp. oral taxon 190]
MSEPPATKATTEAPLSELGTQYAALARVLGFPRGEAKPQRIVEFTHEAVPHAQACALTLVRDRTRPRTVASTHELAGALDELQYTYGEGPCLEASEGDDLVLVPDLADEDRWPRFTNAAVARSGVRAMMCARLQLGDGDRAALNLYANEPGAFDEADMAAASVIAPYAALSIEHALRGEDVANLQQALNSNRQIGRAVGILMARELVTADKAYDMLKLASQLLNRKLRDVAVDVEDTGGLPDGVRRRERPQGA